MDILYPPSMIATAIALQYVAAVPIEGSCILHPPIVAAENAARYYFPC